MRTGRAFASIAVVVVVSACSERGRSSHDPLLAPFLANDREKLEQTAPSASARAAVLETQPSTQAGGTRSEGCVTSECHAPVVAAARLHAPVAAGVCSSCHEETGDPWSHQFRLRGDETVLCTPCHPARPSKAVVHGPFAESRCLECHGPHGSNARPLLRGESAAATCAKCHEAKSDAVVHGPYAIGQCDLCHRAHQSEVRGLLLFEKQDLCLTCHTAMGRTLATAAFVHGPAISDCGACHAPHTSASRGLLRRDLHGLCMSCHADLEQLLRQEKVVHGALDDEHGCAGCHSPHASDFKSLLRENTADLCLRCHDRQLVDPRTGATVAEVASTIRSSLFPHGPVQNGDCQGCHRPHSSEHANLLRKAFPDAFYAPYEETRYDLCFQCHERRLATDERTATLTRFRHGDRNLHYVHVHREKGRSCRACHEVHASNHPYHIRDTVPFGDNNWELPIKFERTETGGLCTPGCHRTAAYDNSTSATLEPPQGDAASKGGRP